MYFLPKLKNPDENENENENSESKQSEQNSLDNNSNTDDEQKRANSGGSSNSSSSNSNTNSNNNNNNNSNDLEIKRERNENCSTKIDRNDGECNTVNNGKLMNTLLWYTRSMSNKRLYAKPYTKKMFSLNIFLFKRAAHTFLTNLNWP